MSKTAIFVALALAAVLGAVLLLTGPRGGTPATTTGIGSVALAVDPAEVTSIRVERASGETSEVRRLADGRWIAPLPGGARWPADGTQASDALRLARELVRAGEVAEGDRVPPDAPRVVIGREGLESVELRFGRDDVGGNTLCEIDGDETILVDAAVRDALLEPGPAGWRLDQALPAGADTGRLTIEHPAGRIALGRVEGRWSLRAPVAVRAEASAVDRALAAVGRMRIERFLPESPAEAVSGLAAPRMTIAVERDERTFEDGELRVRVERRRVRIGRPSTLDAEVFHALVESDDGDVHAMVRAAALPEVEPSVYVASTPSAVYPADVGGLVLRAEPGGDERRYRRRVGRWEVVPGGDRPPVPAPEEESVGIERLLALLTREPALPALLDDPERFRGYVRIDLLASGGDRLDTILAGYDVDDAFGFRVGEVVWRHAGRPAPTLLAMPAADAAPLEPAPPAPTPPAPPADRPIGK